MQVKHKNTIKRVVDVGLTITLLCLMAYQVTGEALHEWLGIGMTMLVIIHQILNFKWYGALFKGKYHALRILQTAVNVLLLLSFAITALCGMAMSGHAVPFLYGMLPVSFASQFHLSLSHWAFALMGLHLGIHIPLMTAKLKGKKKNVLSSIFCVVGAAGLFFFLKNGLYNYLFFRVPFAFLDYEKPAALVFAENITILLFFAFIGMQAAELCKRLKRKGNSKKSLLSVLLMIISIVIGSILFATSGGS